VDSRLCKEFLALEKFVDNCAPILRIFYPYVDFIVGMYACKEGLGGVLSQNGNVVFYK
jgi:hypothetical protein